MMKLARFNLIFCLFIILWGAWVRLSGSGAGCGESWPLCEGEVIPMAIDPKKLVEFIHRATSGLFGITVFAQTLLAFKNFPKSHPFFKGSCLVLFFTVVESLIGAFLVKKGLVNDNQNFLRILATGLHLINTFFLLGALTLADFFSQKKTYERQPWTQRQKNYWLFGFCALLFVGATGAMAALGHTLFPSPHLLHGLLADFNSQSHWLIRWRILHPTLAVLTFIFVLVETLYGKESKCLPPRETQILLSLFFGQIFLGGLNWFWLAPPLLALGHLFLADLIWIFFIRQSCHFNQS